MASAKRSVFCVNRFRWARPLRQAATVGCLTLSLLSAAGTREATAQVDVTITADNAYRFAFGTATAITTFGSGVENCTAGDIFFGPETYTIPNNIDLTTAYIYIWAWSDDQTTQGVIAQLQQGTTVVMSGQGPWEVYSVGDGRDITSSCFGDGCAPSPPTSPFGAPSDTDFSNAITTANSSAGWRNLASGFLVFGDDNTGTAGNNPPYSDFGAVSGINGAARWMWRNPVPGTITNPFRVTGNMTCALSQQQESLLFRLGPLSQVLDTHVGVNKDIRNNTGITANDLEILVEGTYTSVRSHFDGGFPNFAINALGPNTQFRWSGMTVNSGQVKHVGIDLDGPTMKILGVFWTFNNSAIGCAPQCNSLYGTHSSGTRQVIYRNNVSSCSSQALYAGRLKVEYFDVPPPLAEWNATGIRSPMAVDSIATTPVLINPGDEAAVSVPNPPPSAKYALLIFKVGLDANLTGPSVTNDFSLVPIPPVQDPPPPADGIPTLSWWGLTLLPLMILLWTMVVFRRKHRAGTSPN